MQNYELCMLCYHGDHHPLAELLVLCHDYLVLYLVTHQQFPIINKYKYVTCVCVFAGF